MANLLSKKITDRIEASVVAANSDANLEQPLWAINWFDVKSKWLYNLYLKLAVGHVRAIGGKPLFKGHRIEHIEGNEGLGRQMLVIVKYPSGTAFLNLISNTVFQIKSIFRRKSVRNFTFGFMTANEDFLRPKIGEEQASRKLLYLVHHFEGTDQQAVIDLLKKNASGQDIFFQFHGQRRALLGFSRDDQKIKTLPCLADNTLIFAAFEKDQLNQWIGSDLYQKLIAGSKNNYLGVFKREF